jgi:hypothetical protein
MFKLQTALDRQSPTLIIDDSLLRGPRLFLLPSTFTVAGVVSGDGQRFRSSQASTSVRRSTGPPYSRSRSASGCEYFGDTCGCVPPSAATWQEEGLAAPWLLLQEDVGFAAEVLCL